MDIEASCFLDIVGMLGKSYQGRTIFFENGENQVYARAYKLNNQYILEGEKISLGTTLKSIKNHFNIEIRNNAIPVYKDN